jgi:hypothetical protein
VALGPGAIYFSRVAAQASKTRITRLMGMPVFRQMTVRNRRTTTRLFRDSLGKRLEPNDNASDAIITAPRDKRSVIGVVKPALEG